MVARLSTASLVMCALPHSVLIKTTASLTVIVRPLVKCRVASLGLTAQATAGIKPVFTPFFNVLSCRLVLEPELSSATSFLTLCSNLPAGPDYGLRHTSSVFTIPRRRPAPRSPSWSYDHRGNTPTPWSKLTSRGLCLLQCPSSAPLCPGSSRLV